MDYRITNIVMKTQLFSNNLIDLKALAKDLCSVVYCPARFSGLVWKNRTIGGCCLVFNSGMLIINGFAVLEKARKAARQYARLLQRKLKTGVLRPMHIVTMTLLADVKQALNLPLLRNVLSAEYETELFNALTFRRAKIHFSVFQTGKIVVTGVKSMKLIDTEVIPALLEIMIV